MDIPAAEGAFRKNSVRSIPGGALASGWRVSKMALGVPTASEMNDYSVYSRLRLITNNIDLSNKTVLDVGCGNGIYSIKMSESAKKVVGVDIQQENIDQANINKELYANREKVSFLVGDFNAFHCHGDEKFDIITLIEVLEHIPDEKTVLKNMYDCLTNKGNLIIFAPNKFYPFETHGIKRYGKLISYKDSTPLVSYLPAGIRKNFLDEKIYTLHSLKIILEENGFTIKYYDYYFPPLDQLKNKSLKDALRKIFGVFHKTPLKIFGMSIFIIAEKKD